MESAPIMPLRFKFSGLIVIHLIPFNLTMHGCDGDPIQVMLSTFWELGSTALYCTEHST